MLCIRILGFKLGFEFSFYFKALDYNFSFRALDLGVGFFF
jgi:hypothetical protein